MDAEGKASFDGLLDDPSQGMAEDFVNLPLAPPTPEQRAALRKVLPKHTKLNRNAGWGKIIKTLRAELNDADLQE
eukprot:14515484-Alexandrium_andersonii.AAC.1